MKKTCRASHLCDLSDVLHGRELISFSMTPELWPILLSIDGSPDYRLVREGASFPKLFAEKQNHFRIHYLIDDCWFAVDLPPTHENYHLVQPLPSARWLGVRGRAKSVEDKNAHVFEADGCPVHQFHAGDGIEDCQVTTNGMIWTSYFDEGVFSEVPTGESGLICLDSNGQKVFTFESAAGQIGTISDCYALNVSTHYDVWLCYYRDFPIVHLRNGVVENSWMRNPVSGSHAFAVTDDTILFAECYKHKGVLRRLSLTNMAVENHEVTSNNGITLRNFWAVGRGHKLVLHSNGVLFEVDARCF